MVESQDGYIKPGALVELDEDIAAFLHSEVIQCARPPDRKHAEETTYPPMDFTAVPAMLCTDLGFCPNGFSFEIKPKLGIADCGIPECGIPDVPRFAMLQCIDFPKKKKSLSKYNPVRLFQAVLYQQKKQLREELGFLRDASCDARQNNFRLLGHQNEAHLVPDAALDDLCEVALFEFYCCFFLKAACSWIILNNWHVHSKEAMGRSVRVDSTFTLFLFLFVLGLAIALNLPFSW